MNTKMLVLTGLIVVVLLGAGVGGFVYMQKSPAGKLGQVTQKTEANVLTSVKDLFTKTLSLTCSFTDEQGRETMTYIKNGSVRADFTGKTAKESGSVIVKNKKMYLWTADKKGFTMDVTEAQMNGSAKTPVAKGVTPSESKQPAQSNILADLEKYKNNCKSATVDDGLFNPPTDIEFTDLSKLMKAVPTMPPVTPGDEKTPINPETLKNLMKQYAPSGAPEQP